jgi:hypothetical protein
MVGHPSAKLLSAEISQVEMANRDLWRVFKLPTERGSATRSSFAKQNALESAKVS